jgi:hypothetical protein
MHARPVELAAPATRALRPAHVGPRLHLAVSLRSFRAERVSDLVRAMLVPNPALAQDIYRTLADRYPISVTRSLARARTWLRTRARGSERYGLLASSGAHRLTPLGINVSASINVEYWFLNERSDVRSSYYLEGAATEFDIQGLELDWTCVAWDADMRFINGQWQLKSFVGTAWQNVNQAERRWYLANAYRVLLTRARQGMVIFVPEGDRDDVTRLPEFYDGTYDYFRQIGFEAL